jgi:hypothetical protein
MVSLYDKSGRTKQVVLTYIDYGLSVLTREVVIEYIPAATVQDLADTFRALSIAGRLAGYVAPNRFYEVGSPSGIEALEAYLSSQYMLESRGGNS